VTFIVHRVFGKILIFIISAYEHCTRAIHPHSGLVSRRIQPENLQFSRRISNSANEFSIQPSESAFRKRCLVTSVRQGLLLSTT
jgi:hypothetical protein